MRTDFTERMLKQGHAAMQALPTESRSSIARMQLASLLGVNLDNKNKLDELAKLLGQNEWRAE